MKDARMVMQGSTWISTCTAGASAEGLPCLTEVEVSYEGTGPMIDVLKKMGTPDAFAIPPDYAESTQNPLSPPR